MNVKSKWLPEVAHHGPKVPVILVGTKKDIRDSRQQNPADNPPEMYTTQEVESEIKRERKLGRNIFAYVECSARTQENVSLIFEKAVEAHRLGINSRRKKRCVIL